MSTGTLLGDYIRQQHQKKQREDRKALMESQELGVLERLWDDWDGMQLITLNGEYIPESELLIELQRRGSDRHI